ncbi:E3 ubiquitin-protein ligase [Acrasis kona]|uniref:E3 ubiquitin-protein ligase n=1 Tax=Acrasis kona TaxID=1008807 RepID=A0AAW2Z7I0_9EUKA
MEDIKEEYQRSNDKQKSSMDALTNEVDSLITVLEGFQQELQTNENANVSSIAQKVSSSIAKNSSNVQKIHKEINSTFTKLGKSIDKAMHQNQEQANVKPQNWTADQRLIDQLVAQHLYREGNLEVAEALEREANVSIGEQYKAPFSQMFVVLQELQKHNIEPALKWCRDNNLEESQLAFRLHKLAFIQLLNASDQTMVNRKKAIEYARVHFKSFSKQNMNEILHLMGSLVYAGKLQASAQYQDLYLQDPRANNLWEDAANDLKQECCRIGGRPVQPPLYVSVTAGSQALPTLIKMISVTQGKAGLDQVVNSETLGVEIDLDDSFQFHSIFACPVSKELSISPENPPMLLPCGHVLLKSSILKLVRSIHSRFKCPYCPTECSVSDCSPLSF